MYLPRFPRVTSATRPCLMQFPHPGKEKWEAHPSGRYDIVLILHSTACTLSRVYMMWSVLPVSVNQSMSEPDSHAYTPHVLATSAQTSAPCSKSAYIQWNPHTYTCPPTHTHTHRHTHTHTHTHIRALVMEGLQ